MDWHDIFTLGALLIAVLAALSRTLDKSLSVREHEEFRAGMARELAQLRLDYHRDDERIERRLDLIEQTRPTTGELDARIRMIHPRSET